MIAAPPLSILQPPIFATYETDPQSHGGGYRHSCRRAALLVRRDHLYVGVLLCRNPDVINHSKHKNMKSKFIDWCEFHFNGVTDFIARALFTASAITALITVANIICPIL